MLITAAGRDEVDGGEGDDTIHGGLDNDTLRGGAGYDTLYGGAGADLLEGGEDSDLLAGGNGNDVLMWCPVTTSWPVEASIWLVSGGLSDGFDSADYSVVSSPISIEVIEDITNGDLAILVTGSEVGTDTLSASKRSSLRLKLTRS